MDSRNSSNGERRVLRAPFVPPGRCTIPPLVEDPTFLQKHKQFYQRIREDQDRAISGAQSFAPENFKFSFRAALQDIWVPPHAPKRAKHDNGVRRSGTETWDLGSTRRRKLPRGKATAVKTAEGRVGNRPCLKAQRRGRQVSCGRPERRWAYFSTAIAACVAVFIEFIGFYMAP
ncbi:hypothetical protein HPB50_023450 [Hyalomma asiaticum]|uniref:Uncharacterized protein n=1 Tax=Hyalomma asiaticum TaxID=266040 RepID=A0ACB7TTT4_HYAAI|nr:hypothetical protein HPB50_023450 [Hyalomma asiaticum]